MSFELSNPVVKEALEYGVDLDMLEANLSLSPEERLKNHDRALELVRELKRAGEKLYATHRKPDSNLTRSSN